MFYFDKVSDREVLKSNLLKTEHFFTTREFILKTKDPLLVGIADKNKEFIREKFNLKALISPEQTHTTNISHAVPDISKYPDTDALILTDKNTGVFLNFADCTPIILYDTFQNIGAVIHAGWRGTAGRISYKTVIKMKKEFNSNPNNIVALIGPCICFNHFETNEEIALQLQKTVKDKKWIIKNERLKFYADLKEINARQLIEAGVKIIDIAPYCTVCNNDKFFSFRKENKTTNRISAFLALN